MYDFNGNKLLRAYTYSGSVIGEIIPDEPFDPDAEEYDNENQNTGVSIFINQAGYDSDWAKRATVTNAERGDAFTVRRTSDNGIVYSGVIKNQIADFTSLSTDGDYYIDYAGLHSYDFKVRKNRLVDLLKLPLLKFMEETRSDAFCRGGNQIAWRDSHQFSFELQGLVMMYMANPEYYESLPWDVYMASECEYEELRTQDCPNIVWLMKFAAMRYYEKNTENGNHLHALTKAQVAYFLWLYPHISKYIDHSWYVTIRDWTISIWGDPECNLSWFADNGLPNGDVSSNLYIAQDRFGSNKGNLPPGAFVVPNMLMYEVAVRDGIPSDAFKQATIDNLNWLVNTVDMSSQNCCKGQRMSEVQGVHNLTMAYEMHPELCPTRTYSVICKVAERNIYRSKNLWDFRMLSKRDPNIGIWASVWIPDANEPGNVAGFTGCALALARVVRDANTKARLKQIAIAAQDSVFGRNPYGKCYMYDAVRDFDGAKEGWFSKFGATLGDNYSGPGVLKGVTAGLDGSPKRAAYPYNPDADYGYTEGWVAFNSAWNMSLAYLMAESTECGIGMFARK